MSGLLPSQNLEANPQLREQTFHFLARMSTFILGTNMLIHILLIAKTHGLQGIQYPANRSGQLSLAQNTEMILMPNYTIVLFLCQITSSLNSIAHHLPCLPLTKHI